MIVVAIIGVLAAIAIPNFMRFQARSKQSEAKTALRTLFTGQKAYFAEKDRYSLNTGDVAFAPERGNRYLYDLGVLGGGGTCPAGNMESRTGAVAVPANNECGVQADVFRHGSAAQVSNLTNFAGVGAVTVGSTLTGLTAVAPGPVAVGVYGVCPLCGFSAVARGNVDGDPGTDVFVVSSDFLGVATAGCVEDGLTAESPGSPINIRSDVVCE